MKKKIVSLALAGTLLLGGLAACGKGSDSKNAGGKSGEKVSFTLLNTKSEIQPQLEKMAKEYSEANNVNMEVLVTVGDSPSQDITKRYASGEAPTLFMGDVQDIYLMQEYALDMAKEKFAEVQGVKEYGVVQDDKLIAFPLCIEARGLMYNKTAIEKATGEAFDPEAVNTVDEFKALLDKLIAGGMENPLTINMEDWSLAGHFLTMVYEEQGESMDDVNQFIDDLKAGSVDLKSNERWNSLMDTFEVMKDYNMNKADPMAANYDANAVALAEGTVGFWFNGNWAWAEMKDFVDENSEYGIMPVPQTNTDNGVTDKLAGSASKRIMIDTKYNSEEQQKAALDWLNWLAYDEKGQDFLVNECDLIPALANNTLEVSNPLGASVQAYARNNALIDGYPYYPGDHWKQMGASFQEYLAGQVDRNGLADATVEYWKNQK